ncbi:hypothetical protein L6452_19831 [Arctium lappa]|uniref:Uncharacterized protein n=1 Tax=Arctium lappa TaxID=4217 RepID=A0ACB9BB15_ARCLA|nr:hypothetical protein L6452_19831 [Arctium lappa]
MRDAWGREPTSDEVREATHCTNRKLVPGATGPPTDPPIYVYPKAARMADNYHRIREEDYPDLPPGTVPPNDAEL